MRKEIQDILEIKILSGWKDANWQRPYVEEKVNPDKVVLHLPMESLLPQEVKEQLIEIFGKEIESIGYEKLVALSIACSEGEVNNDRLQYVIDKHSSDISKILKDLCNLGFLHATGKGRGTKYYLIGNDANIATSEPNVASLESNVASLGSNVASLESNVASLGSNVASLESNVASSGKVKKYLNKKDLESIIIGICNEFTPLEEIAKVVQRDIRYLNNHIIPQMIKEGKLERLFNIRSHPNQKYKAK